MSTSYQVGTVPVLRVDFNDLEDRVFISARPRNQAIPLPGSLVMLTDAEDNICYGRVQVVTGPLVRVRIDRATWVAGDEADRTQRITFGTVVQTISEQIFATA